MESGRPENRLLQESWQENTVAWIRVIAVEMVKNANILRYFQSCTHRFAIGLDEWVRGEKKSKDG